MAAPDDILSVLRKRGIDEQTRNEMLAIAHSLMGEIEPTPRDAESRGSVPAMPERACRLASPASPRGKTAPPRWPDDPAGGWGCAHGRDQSVGRRGEPVVSGESVPPPIERAPGPFYSLR